jgi:hypothetical protein
MRAVARSHQSLSAYKVVDMSDRYLTTPNGKPQLLFLGERYYRERVCGDKTIWRCIKYASKLKCTAQCHTNPDSIRVMSAHSHKTIANADQGSPCPTEKDLLTNQQFPDQREVKTVTEVSYVCAGCNSKSEPTLKMYGVWNREDPNTNSPRIGCRPPRMNGPDAAKLETVTEEEEDSKSYRYANLCSKTVNAVFKHPYSAAPASANKTRPKPWK